MDYDFYNPYLLNKLDTIDAEELMATPYAPKNFIVADMLPEGLTLLCGPSKIGKSWFVLQLCLCVALGRMFLGHNIISSDVLYLALEDTFARVKDRVARLTEECPTNLRFAVQAGTLGGELEEQLVNHKTQYPDTKLVVIDTLQKVRGASDPKAGSPTYGKDYADIGSLKKLADDLGIAIVLVHHLRKTQDKDDPFNEISGTTGLMGAADTVLLLKKVNRGTDTTFLYLTGRDIEFRAMAIEFTNCYWRLDEDVPPHDGICYRPLAPIVKTVCEYIKEHKHFRGTASELLALLGEENVKPNVLTRSLSTEAYDYLQQVGILYDSGRTGNGRWLELTLVPRDDSTVNDGCNANDEKISAEEIPTQSSLTVTDG